jgi:DNA-binding MarR family transcriptional regulator
MRITENDRVLQIVGDLERVVVELRDPALRRVGIGREHWQVLRLLADGEGHAMGELSEAMNLPGATATRVVDSLAQRMQIHRRSDPLDRRRVLIYLAEPGHETLEQVGKAILEQTEALLAGFDPAEREEFLRLLDLLVVAGSGKLRTTAPNMSTTLGASEVLPGMAPPRANRRRRRVTDLHSRSTPDAKP